MLIAETKIADIVQEIQRKRKTPCHITKWGSNMYTEYAKHIAQSTTQNSLKIYQGTLSAVCTQSKQEVASLDPDIY